MQIGYIGAGKIGNPMARSLLRAGHAMKVHDINEAATANLIELGAVWADSAAAACAGPEVIFTSLPGPVEVEEVLMGKDGILAGAAEGTVYFDLSSKLLSV